MVDPDHATIPPSINLNITQDDANRIMEASRALRECLARTKNEEGSGSSIGSGESKEKLSTSATKIKEEKFCASSSKYNNCTSKGGNSENDDNLRLHARLLKAARICDHPMIQSFFVKMTASGLTTHEAEAGIVLFHEMDKSSKLKLFFHVLLSEKTLIDGNAKSGLNRQGTLALFKSVLSALSCCLDKEENDVDTKNSKSEDQTAFEPPRKAIKYEEDSTPHSELNVSSFDSCLPLLKSEDDEEQCSGNISALPETVRRDIKAVSTYAADQFISFVSKKKMVTSFEAFGEWYNSGGCNSVPWLELLHISKWKTAASEMAFASTTTSNSTNYTKESPSQLPNDHSLKQTPTRAYMQDDPCSRTIVSFDFSGSMLAGHGSAKNVKPLRISISEENLFVFRNLVLRTNLIYRSAPDICKQILRVSNKRTLDNGRQQVTLRRDDFRRYAIPKLIDASLTGAEIETFSIHFEDFFRCFEGIDRSLQPDEVNAKELAVGFCFLCKGKKSAKLATAYELLDDMRYGVLSQSDLIRFLRSYLTMLVGMTFLRERRKDGLRRKNSCSPERSRALRIAVENGAKWTLGHFLEYISKRDPRSRKKDAYPFECFAEWYSSGGYNVAPWLELLDLNKLVSLIDPINSNSSRSQHYDAYNDASSSRRNHYHHASPPSSRDGRSSHRRHHHNRSTAPRAQFLFTFPLANRRSLVVLRDDATYVRGVVEQLGLLSLAPEDIWSSLSNEVRKRPQYSQGRSRKKNFDFDKTMLVNQQVFLDCMERAFKLAGRKGPATSGYKQSSIRELLSNFYHSFDINQIDSVMINELMGGLTLLCGGKKSTKLAFAFSVFDSQVEPQTKGSRKRMIIPETRVHSLNEKDLFLFLRSFLIVMFSCCCHSLDMLDDEVDRIIADTSHMVAKDVMHYQWNSRKKNRVDFDEFGEWYNEGGFEVAPWLELLDLKKWVLVDNFDALESHNAPVSSMTQMGSSTRSPQHRRPEPPRQRYDHHHELEQQEQQVKLGGIEDPKCPPAPPEDDLDPNFLNDVDNDILQMDSMDEMDMILLGDKENDMLQDNKINKSPTYSPDRRQQQQKQQSTSEQNRRSNSLKFHLVTDDEHNGFMLSISQKRIQHLRQILLESGLYKIDAEEACNKILRIASKSPRSSYITKNDFDVAMHDLIFKNKKISDSTQTVLRDILSCIFAAFDIDQTGKPSAIEVACGFTVLCKGKKSDKLEFAFDVLDKHKKGKLSKQDMSNYLRSFLTVLMSIACTPSLDTDPDEDSVTTMKSNTICDRSTLSVIRCVESGSRWAVAEAFKTGLLGQTTGASKNFDPMISFDDFAAWYTHVGYSSIPWLELLDLNKWVVTET